jgi:RNAse (barnase) inhibitor barstar
MKTRSAEQTIDVSRIYDDETLHEYLSARLGFPGFYGMNWDAFWDCITDDEMSSMPTVLKIKGIEDLRRLAPDTERNFSKCLNDYLAEIPDRKVIFE